MHVWEIWILYVFSSIIKGENIKRIYCCVSKSAHFSDDNHWKCVGCHESSKQAYICLLYSNYLICCDIILQIRRNWTNYNIKSTFTFYIGLIIHSPYLIDVIFVLFLGILLYPAALAVYQKKIIKNFPWNDMIIKILSYKQTNTCIPTINSL